MSASSQLPRSALLAIAVVVSAGLVAVITLLGSGGSGPAPIGGTPESAADEGDATAAPRVSPFRDRDAAEEPLAEDEIGRTEVEPDAAAAAEDGLLLTVVEAATSRPLPGAEVFFTEEPGVAFGRRDGRHWATRVLEAGARVVADSSGRAALPAVRGRMFVASRTESLFGVAVLRRGMTEATVTLEPDRTITVRVTGADGRPRADVDVVLAVDRVQRLDARASATTNADGIAELPHVQLFRARLPQVEPATRARAEQLLNRAATLEQAARGERASVAVNVRVERRQELDSVRQELRGIVRQVLERERRARAQPASMPVAPTWAEFVVTARAPQLTPGIARFPADAVPGGIVDLRLGTVGSLAVRLVGPGGAALWPPCRIEVRRSRANPMPGSVVPALVDSLRNLSQLQRDKPVGDHTVVFGPVGSGTLLDVRVDFPDDDFTFEQTGVAGPVAEEERVVEIAVPGWFTVLSGRLVAPDGQPWPELRANMLLSGAGGRIEGEPITTDSDGRFELPVRVREPAPPFTLEVQARRGEDPLGALVDVTTLEAGRRHELGDLVVGPLPVLAQGTVRDDRGEPIAGADLSLQAFRTAAGDGGGWQDVAYVRVRSDESGAFRMFGERRDDRLRVRARMRGHARVDSPEFRFGATVDLTLTRLGQLVASGQAPEWLPRGAVQLEVSRDGRRVRRQDLRMRRDGAFRTAMALEPGVYDVACTLRNVGAIVRTFAVVVEPGDATTLSGLDLRDAVFRYEVRAVDQNGQAMRDPGSPLLAQIAEPGRPPHWVGFPWRGDRVEFFSTDRSALVVALANGHRPVRTVIAPGESQVVLAQLHPVEIELPGLRAMVGERRVRISLVYEGDTGLPMTDFQAIEQTRGRGRGYPRAALGKSGGAWLGGNDTVRVPLMMNGRYRVVARISEPGKRGNVSKDIGTVDAVLDGAGVQHAVVAPPAPVIQQALAELAAR